MSNNDHKNSSLKIELPLINQSKGEQKRKYYWRSLDQLFNATSDAVIKSKKSEFLDGVTTDFKLEEMPEPSRRKFLALMAASGAFAATACTDYRDKGEIIAYNVKPESIIPGIANYYASTVVTRGKAYGVLIKTREGRPIKVDGNPQHPINKGKIENITQAEIINLYDPNRLTHPKMKTDKSMNLDSHKTDWKDIDANVIAKLKAAVSSGKEIAVLANPTTGPTQAKLYSDFVNAYPTAKFYHYEAISEVNKINAWEKSFGNNNVLNFDLSKAKIVLCLENDFMDIEPESSVNINHFAKTRNIEDLDNYSRLYSIESALTMTGSNADYRLRLRPELQIDLLYALLHEISKKGINVESSVANKSNGVNAFAKSNHLDSKVLNQLVNDLIDNKGKSAILTGILLNEDAHVLANYLNYVLGNFQIANSQFANYYSSKFASVNDLKELTNNANSGNVAVLINVDVNPVYDFTDDLNFATAISKVETVITLCEQENETSQLSNVILPINHSFESWGDHKNKTSLISLQQPVIEPLYNTRQKEAVLLTWILGDAKSYNNDIYHKYMMETWTSVIYPAVSPAVSFKEFWYSCLHDGFVEHTENVEILEFNVNSLSGINSSKANGMTLVLQPSHAVYDGRYANNGYLQEMPHPTSKICWDNYVAISPKNALELGLEYKDVVKVNIDGRSLEMPIMLQPGQADDTLVIELGNGRTFAGAVGTGVGFDSSVLLSSKGGLSQWIYSNATIEKVGTKYDLCSTQEHHVLDDQLTKPDGTLNDFHKVRGIIKETSVKEYQADKKVLKHHEHKVFSITTDHVYTELKWAMAIDLNKCVGCNLCSTACFVENNIPVVGKEQVAVGREMSWIRIDRYYTGNYENPQVSNQPMLCMHCDNAPCENVCPVVATTHSPDGLNQMVYNRCVGTRYCANNCPYKVRRFNFFDFRDHVADGFYKADSMKLAMNPEVSVRARGVMEKCTFCTQRIMEARQIAREKGRPPVGSDVTTACQEACPADAIYFGDANDPNSAVAKLREHDLGYHVLDYMNVKPNVTYVAKLRNVNEVNEVSHSGH